jgi:hypothetical protein
MRYRYQITRFDVPRQIVKVFRLYLLTLVHQNMMREAYLAYGVTLKSRQITCRP